MNNYNDFDEQHVLFNQKYFKVTVLFYDTFCVVVFYLTNIKFVTCATIDLFLCFTELNV